MTEDRQKFMSRLLDTFRREAEMHLAATSLLLKTLEQAPPEDGPRIIGELIREMHSMKGAASAVNQQGVEYLSRSLEQVLLLLQKREISLSAAFFDTFALSHDLIEQGVKEGLEGREFTVPLQFFDSLRKLN